MRRAEELSCVTPLRANPVRRPDDTSERRAVPCGLGHVRENWADTDLRANHSGVCRAGKPRQIGTGAAVAGHRNPVWPHIGVCRADPQRRDDADPIRVGARPNPVDDAGSATASRNRVTVARTHPGHQRWTVPGGSFRGVATDVRCHRHRSTAPTAPGRGSGLAPPCLAARRSAGCGGLGRPRRGENECAGETVRTICCPARSGTVRARAVDLAQRLVRTYVILVLPKCLLTWGYVKVDPAAFLSTARGTGTAHPPGRWRFDL